MKKDNSELEGKILSFIKDFKANSHGLAFITEKVAFDMKALVRKNRQNYWGVFNEQADPNTGRKKIWAPLTRFMVDTTDKNTHVDEKEITFRAKDPEKQSTTRVVRGYGQNQMRKMNFGTRMDALRKQKFIDGTSIVRVNKAVKNDEGITVDMKRVDRLNFDIDVTCDSIKQAPAVGERDLMSPYAVKLETEWINTEDIKGRENLSRNDAEGSNTTTREKLVDVYRYEGLAPTWFITGEIDEESSDQELMSIIVSNLEDEARVHLVKKIKKKTYIENWAEKVPGRWDGYSPAERVAMMQIYQNQVLNTRIIKNSVASLGLFKIKKGSGVTPQAIGRLAGNGAIKVNQMDDIENWPVNEASQASYNDEEVATKWAQRDTSSFDAATGEEGRITTATEAAITAKSAGSSFEQMAKEEGNFWERVFNEHILDIWGNCIKKGEIIRLTLDGEELRDYDLEIAERKAIEYIDDAGKAGIQYIDVAELEAVKQKALEDLEKGNTDRYEEAEEDLNLADYDTEVVVKAQRFDRNLVAQGLMSLGQMDPRLMEQVIPQLNDLWGVNLKMPKALPEEQMQEQLGGQPQSTPTNVQQQLTGALTQQGQGL